ncbi:Undecaprenol kinase [Bacillus sp. THAF10]|uniref:diacylglycerol kinase family protein n=1 Tax=Bacillus sp. THAF10 TaxID=2587848 RepID=UPI001268FF34|nr:diacylglycerol kinase family protein [Bacillus sp. THAF10]QFT89894.1 Undecaprenol kinase [Bacillus sp. THAF10]
MTMDSKDPKPKSFRGSFGKSFQFALEGLQHVIKTERNIKIHICIAFLVILLSLFFQITTTEWAIVFLVIGMMVVIEIFNTAIENVVDLVTKEYHPLAKIAKDVAASAALVFACISFIIGVILFSPYLLNIFK